MASTRKAMEASTYAYARVFIFVAPVPILHFGYWFLLSLIAFFNHFFCHFCSADHGSDRMQKRWGLDKKNERDLYYRKKLIVDRRRKALDQLRENYESERKIFKIEFEKWVHRCGPDTPSEFTNH